MARTSNVTIKPRRHERADKIIRRFNKKIKKNKIIEQARERRYYLKPSERKRLQKKRAEARRLKEIRKRSN